MENKIQSNNLPQVNKRDDKEMNNSELEYQSKPERNSSHPNCIEMNEQVDPLKNPGPVLVIEDKNKCEIPEKSSQDFTTTARCTSRIINESTRDNLQKQIHESGIDSASGEKQRLVLNLKDMSGMSIHSKDNSEVIKNLKEGVGDIAKACAVHEYKEEESQNNCSSPIDSANCCEDHFTENRVLPPASINMMEGCNSCSQINKGRSREPTSNSQTQTVNHISISTVTDTNTSTHRTCSSQTATQGQRNRSAQTTCVQATQECQITPDYTTTSCQTSIPTSNNIRRIVIKPWAARKYQDMCMCAELGAPCTCANRKTSSWGMVLPRNSSWWPAVKKTLLIIAAIIPWVFLIVYSVYYYRAKY